MEYPRKYGLLFFVFFIHTLSAHLCYLNNSYLINYYHDFISADQIYCLPCYYKCTTCNSTTSSNCNNSCEIGFYYNNNSCVQCPLYCNVCNSSICLECEIGYFLFNNICLKCSTGVLGCSISSNISCMIGYYYTSSSTCLSCIQNCINCTDSISCNSCNKAYYYNISASRCNNCGLGCFSCFQYSTCQTCLNNYLLNSSGACNLANNNCTSNCFQCSSGKCLLCQNGYFLNNGTCIQGSSIMCLFSSNFDFGSCLSCSQYAYPPSGTTTYCIPNIYNASLDYIFLTSVNNKQIFGNTSTYCDLIISPSTNKFLVNLTLTPSYYIQIYINLFYESIIPTLNLSVTIISIFSMNSQNFSLITQKVQQYCNTSLIGSVISMNSSVDYPNITLQISSSNLLSNNFSIYQIFVVQSLCQIDNCLTCYNAIICTSCKTPYLLLKSKCVSICDSGYYTNYDLMKCQLVCTIGYYTDLSNYQCVICKPPCLTCNSSTQCLSCTSLNGIRTYLDGSSCNSICSLNTTYPNQINNTCSKCINPCNTCSYTGSNCTSCNNGYLYNNSCVGVCPAGTYGQFNLIIICSPCKGCYTCQITAINCLSCSNNTVLFNNSCINMCPAGFYNLSLICATCILPCKTCLYYNQNCTNCSIGNLYVDSNYRGLCLLNCPDKYYNNSNNICSPCQLGCIKCLSNNICLQCMNITNNQNTITIYYLQNGNCIITCLYGFHNSSNNQCSSCKYPCVTCVADNTGNKCNSCHFPFYLLNFSCKITCPIGYFQYNQTFTCIQCNASCYTCSNSNSCDSCIPIFFNNSLVFAYFNKTCINYLNCPTNLFAFKNISTGLYSCQICNTSCYTCINYSMICTSCYKGMFFIQNQNSCVVICPAGHYSNDSLNCFMCNNNCKTCQNNSNNCLSCLQNTFLLNLNCVNACPSGYYQQFVNLICSACINSCLSCISFIICTACVQNYFLYEYSCINACPIEYAPINNICQLCTGNNCISCFNTLTNCTSCIKNTYLMININGTNTCLNDCPTQYYIDYFSQKCQKCISPCLTCISSNLCLTCAITSPQNYLYHYSCKQICANGTYPNSNLFICSNCTSPCLTCINASICLSCISGFFFLNSNVTNNNNCLIVCPSFYYGNNLTNTCQLCQIPCLTCKSLIYCLSCVSGYLFQSNYCISICLNGTFNDSSTNVCSICSSNCLTCYNSSNQCLTCKSPLILYPNLSNCVKQCPSHHYAEINSLTNKLQCMICSQLCDNCSNFTRCSSCIAGLFLQQYSCISECTISFYKSSGICMSCSSNCQICVNSTFCTICLQFFLYQNACIVECPLKFYPHTQNMTCLNCPSICNSCFNQYYCTSCQKNYALLSNFCVELPCIQPYYYDSTNNSCTIQCSSNLVIDYTNKICYNSCPLNLILFDKKSCVSKCPSNVPYFINNKIECQQRSSDSINLLMFSAVPIAKNDQLQILIIFNNLAQVNNSNTTLFLIDKKSNNNRTISQAKTLVITQMYIRIADTNSMSLNNIAIFVNQSNPYRSITDSNGRVIQNWYTSIFIANYDFYGYVGTNALAILLLIIIGLLYVILVYFDRLWMIWNVLDYSQMLYFICFFDFQLPPSLEPFLVTFSVINFRFMPFFTVPQNILQNSPQKFYQYTTDINFLRNISSNLLILIVFTFLLLTLRILFKFQFMEKYRKIIQNHWNKRYIYIFECFNLCYLNISLFSFLQYSDFTIKSTISSTVTNYLRFNLFAATLFNILCIIIPFGILINIYYQYQKRKSQNITNYYDPHVINNQKSYPEQSIFLEYILTEINLQKKDISVFIQIERFFRRLTFTACLGLYPLNPIFVIIITMLHTVVLITIVYIYQPYIHQLRNNMAIITDLIFLIVLFFIFMLFLNNNMSKDNKIILGGFIQCLFIVLLLVAMFYPLHYLYTVCKQKKISTDEKEQPKQEKNQIQEEFCQNSQNQVIFNQQIVETEHNQGGINKSNSSPNSNPSSSPNSDLDQYQVDTIIQKKNSVPN